MGTVVGPQISTKVPFMHNKLERTPYRCVGSSKVKTPSAKRLIATAMSATERGCVATGRDALMGESCLMIPSSTPGTRLVAFAQSDVILQHQMNMYMFHMFR
jgi:hypothetical protein